MGLSRLIAASLVASAAGAAGDVEVSVTKCTTGAANILVPGHKSHTAQVCNLFGSTCFINHPTIASDMCATEALMIKSGECRLYPIRDFKDNNVRSGADAKELMTTVKDYGCTTSYNSDGSVKFSGACVSVQCETGAEGAMTYAGPAFSGAHNKKREPVTDTTTHTFLAQTIAAITDDADQLKNVFLVRTGNYIGTSDNKRYDKNDIRFQVGRLPTSDGNDYGPVKCPSTGKEMTSSTAADITAENLRMCGSSGAGKWLYYNALNMIEDRPMYARYSGDASGTTPININKVEFLFGKSAYRSGDKMDDPRKVILNDGIKSGDAVFMSSDTFMPMPGNKEPFKSEVGGCWRNFGAAFYCDDYARTDLTKCALANRKVFHVGDPDPNESYGTARGVSSGGGMMGSLCAADADCCSGSCLALICAPGCETAGDIGGGSSVGGGGSSAVGGGSTGSTGSTGTSTGSGSGVYELVGAGACVDSAGKHGAGNLAFTKSTTKGNADHTLCQAACTSDSSCTGYDNRVQGCLYYKIAIVSSNAALTTYHCYRKPVGGAVGGTTSTPDASSAFRAAGGSFALLALFILAC